MGQEKTLYERLGGYAALSAVANDLLPRLIADAQLGRFWQHRGENGVAREKQLLIDCLTSNTGGPINYTGCEMKTAYRGMGIRESDSMSLMGHLDATLDAISVPEPERAEVVAFIEGTKPEIVEA